MSERERATHGAAIESCLAPQRPLFLQDPAMFDLSVIGSTSDTPGLLIFGPSVAGRIALARELRRQLPCLQLVFILPAGDGEGLARTLRFAPGLGDAWTVPAEAGAEALAAVVLAACRAAIAATQRARLTTGLRRMVAASSPPQSSAARQAGAPLAEQLLSTIVDNVAEAIVVCTSGGQILTWNDAAGRLFGAPVEAVAGRQLTDVIGGENLGGLIEAATRLGCVRNVEVPITDARRHPLWIEATVACAAGPGDGTLLLIARDAGERRQRYEQLINDQRASAVRQIAGSMAHDLENILTVLLGSTALLEEELHDNGKLHTLANGARIAAERGVCLSQRLLANACADVQRPERVDAGRLLLDLQRVVIPSLPMKIELVLRVEFGCEINVKRQQLQAALLSLLVNAGEAMPDGGTLELSARTVAAEQAFVALGHRAEDYAEIAIRDTGLGMSPSVAARAFEPFFTTKSDRNASGLGLTIVQSFASEAGGFVTIDTTPGHGTTVRLCIPRAHSPGRLRAV